MPATILLMYLVAFGVAMALSWHPDLGNLRNTAANPILLLAAYAFLVGGDYLSMAVMGGGVLAQHGVFANKITLTLLALQHAVGFCMLCLGIYGGMTYANRRLAAIGRPKAAQASPARQVREPFKVAVFISLLVLWFVLLRANGGEDISLADVARVKQNTINDAALFIASLLLLPAFTYALPNMRFPTAILVSLIAVALLFYSGSRTRLLYVALPLFVAMVQIYRFRLPRSAFVVALVAAGLMAIVALNLRLSAVLGAGTDITATSGGNIFDLPDIPFAESSVALQSLSSTRIEAYIGEDFVGAIFAGVPRSLAPFKPLGGSNQFTAIYDPVNWTRYGRGLTIGGINEINFDYPVPFGFIVIMVIGIVFGIALANVSRSRSEQGFAGIVVIYVVLYQFLKADLQSVGQVVTSFVIYNAAMFAAQPIRLLFAPPPPRNRRRLHRGVPRPLNVPPLPQRRKPIR